FGFPDDTGISFVLAQTLHGLTVVDRGEPVPFGCLARGTFLPTGDSLPYAMPLQHLPCIELHDAFVDWVRHRRSHVGARKVINACDLLRIAFSDHDLEFVMHVDGVGLHEPACLELLQVPKVNRRIDISCSRVILSRVIPSPIDQNPWAHWRSPMDMMRQGWSTSLFHAAQQWSTRSS